MGRADKDVQVRLLSFLQLLISPGIDRTRMLEFVGRCDKAFDGFARMFGRFDLRSFLRGKEPLDLSRSLAASAS